MVLTTAFSENEIKDNNQIRLTISFWLVPVISVQTLPIMVVEKNIRYNGSFYFCTFEFVIRDLRIANQA
jgi:hypothetical protein